MRPPSRNAPSVRQEITERGPARVDAMALDEARRARLELEQLLGQSKEELKAARSELDAKEQVDPVSRPA